MSAASLTVEDPALSQRRRAAWRAVVAGARHGVSAESRQEIARDDASFDARDGGPVTVRQAVGGALVVGVLHAALIAAWLHARPASHEPVVTPPIALQMTAAPQPLPQAPAPKPVTPPKPLPQARHAPKPRHVPTPAQAPSASVPPPAARPSAAPAESAAPAPAAAPAAPAAPAAATAPATQKTTLPDGNADYLHNPAPDYPATAQDYGWQGRVVLHVHVRADGSPDTLEVRRSSGHRVLDDAAVAAVRHWSFVPAKRGDTPVDGWVDVPLNFQLD
ncbi:energy transducer TonB [Burkholderia sp. AU30198]|uniref:energy transducer TonB n=1 Tax=Burkholderia sp. AU30198 TaxID=2879627 RepID=UPI001CF54980|nr:energy transducer TonB [Burkholderia sp. AU30198]MCA8295250.1 energy transducer TonB [Burkholderia sp. AU30198]